MQTACVALNIACTGHPTLREISVEHNRLERILMAERLWIGAAALDLTCS